MTKKKTEFEKSEAKKLREAKKIKPEIKTEESTAEETPETKTEETPGIEAEGKPAEEKPGENKFTPPEATPNKTTNFTEADFTKKPDEEKLIKDAPETKKETRGRKKGSSKKETPNPGEKNPQAEANKMQIVGAAQMVLSALSRINLKGKPLFLDKPLTATESATIGEAFNLAYPDFSINPKVSFWLVFAFVIASRVKMPEQ